ncbi:MAG TPA: hypothetical protein VIV63_16030 [Steroidobacteraceae bacterium]
MRSRLAPLLLLLPLWHSSSFAQCAPAPDSPYFFRNLAEQRAEARLASDRSFYESLLSDHFADKENFIAGELAMHHDASRKGFYAVRNFSLVEHRKGLAVTSYLLVEGDIGEGKSNARETWQREVFEVENGKWRLVSIEDAEPRPNQQAQAPPAG